MTAERICTPEQGNRLPANLSHLRCYNRVGASKGLWIPTAVRMTGMGRFNSGSKTLYAGAGNACPPTLSYLRCHNRVGASKRLRIPTAVRLTGVGRFNTAERLCTLKQGTPARQPVVSSLP